MRTQDEQTPPAASCPVEQPIMRLAFETDIAKRLRMPQTRVSWAEADAQALEAAKEIERLRMALRQVAQSLAWQCFGECRSFGADVALLKPRDADAVARVALGEYRDGR